MITLRNFIALPVMLMGSLIAQIAHAQTPQEPAQFPLFLSNPVTPIMMLNMSKDHQLFFKIYDDYADITDPEGGAPDGEPDITYNNNYKYYGYFDENKCYTYESTNNRNYFHPKGLMVNKYCNAGSTTNEWSGNFLNWATMTRIDAVRKILYGGMRNVDSATATVLQRSMLPNDAHSFAKFYNGSDLNKLTPFTVTHSKTNTPDTGITICNTTNGGTALSQNVTAPPLMRVARGNYMLWASNERYQCKWGANVSGNDGLNGNDPAVTEIQAYNSSPPNDRKQGTGSASGEYQVRVNVCVTGLEEPNCLTYPDGNKKPVGLLQRYGESNRILFGLMTGSYMKSKDGGVLRKAVSGMDDEINSSTNGTFKALSNTTPGIIKTLDLLKIYGYRFDNGTYHSDNTNIPGNASNDGCLWSQDSFNNGQCTNWGNPQAEIYLESLRYLAGKPASTTFAANDSVRISGLVSSPWGDAPVNRLNYCAPLNILQFNASTTSYDGDNLGGFTDLTQTALNTLTNKIGDSDRENLSGDYFVGSNGTNNDQLCTPKSIANLSSVRGTCPDAPRLEGSYHIAGMAYFARRNDILPNLQGEQTVRTFGVALAPAVPKISIPTPNRNASITILPACRNTAGGRSMNCAIVDFKVISTEPNISISNNQYPTGDARRVLNGQRINRGQLYVNWEDSEQGGDYDQDMWGIIEYAVSNTDVVISTRVIRVSTGDPMGFGYVISGTNNDSFHVHSGINNFNVTPCVSCNLGQNNSSPGNVSHKAFKVGTSEAKLLETPLYYAAKWGGYDEDFLKDAKRTGGTNYSVDYLDSLVKNRDVSNSYYFATDPRKLEESLEKAFKEISTTVGSASAVTTNAKRASDGNYVFQAQFNSENWSGTLNVYEFDSNGRLKDAPTYSTRDTNVLPVTGVNRKVYTSKAGGSGRTLINFTDAALTAEQKAILKRRNAAGEVIDSDLKLAQRIGWLRGDATNEGAGGLRDRGTGSLRNIMGDIVNSGPIFVGADNYRYQTLPIGGSSYANYLTEKQQKPARVYVGSNDGMLHAFSVPDKDGAGFAEQYTYIPELVFPKLARLSDQNYGSFENPHTYTVDGDIAVGDVYDDVAGEWRTVLVGTLGAGGRGIYALDITDPTAAPTVLWELSSTDYPGLGFVMGQVNIVPMRNGRFAAVFGNGAYAGESSLFIVDILDTANTKILKTAQGLGLSTPSLLPNGLGQVTAAYAGDINGNLWKFDLSSNDEDDWEVDYRLFKAEHPRAGTTNYPQPITGAPTLGINLSLDGKVMVYFGTGKYTDAGDNSNSNVNIESFYAIADLGQEVTRNQLHVRSMNTNMLAEPPSRTVSNVDATGAPIDWQTDKGWVLDFNSIAGERVIAKPLLIQDRLIFTTVIPSQVSCEFGGNSWMMDLAAVGDRSSYDERYINESIIGGNMYNNFMVLGDLSFVLNGKNASILGSATNAQLIETPASLIDAYTGRQSWRQIK